MKDNQLTELVLTHRDDTFMNNFPENDRIEYRKPKLVPGNSTYANITKHGKNIAILSDSIPGRIKMDEFNRYINNGKAFRDHFPGSTPKKL